MRNNITYKNFKYSNVHAAWDHEKQMITIVYGLSKIQLSTKMVINRSI